MKSLLYILILLIINLIICDDENMNHIIDNIYVGDVVAASDEEYLKQFNITVVVNCAEEITSDYKDLKFLELKLYDLPEEQIIPKFEVAYQFIKKNKKNNNNILVHCSAGASRSAALVIFYMMKETKWDYDYCLWYMQAKRPVVNPNTGFMNKLKDYYFKYIYFS